LQVVRGSRLLHRRISKKCMYVISVT